MIKERYVSFEVASLLRDKGFDEKCVRIYNINNGLIFENYDTCNSELPETNELVTAPTQAISCDWIEEQYGIFIQINRDNQYYEGREVIAVTKEDKERGHKPTYYARFFDKYSESNTTNHYDSKESAFNEALKYVLTNLM